MNLGSWLNDLLFPTEAWAGRIDYSKVSDNVLYVSMAVTGVIVAILAALGVWGLRKYSRERREGKKGWPMWGVVVAVSAVILFWLFIFLYNVP